MTADPRADRHDDLARLVAHAVRRCHGRAGVLKCGPDVLAQWPAQGAPQDGAVIASQPFMAGVETFELDVHGDAPRALTEPEREDFLNAVEALRTALERHPVVAVPPAGPGWVKDHVAAALDYVTESFMLVLSDWTIQHVNTQFEQFTGTRRADVVGRPLFEVFPQMRGTRFESELRAAMAGAVPRRYEERSTASGRWFEVRAFPCKAGLATLTTDVTDRHADAEAREAMEHKLMQAQKLESLGTLASGIAHDFNNLIGAILGHAGLLHEALDRTALPPAVAESLGQIGVAAERARELVQQILTHSRTHRRDVRFQPLQPALEESLRLLRATLPASVRLEAAMDEAPLYATVDPGEVQQVAMNLCTNAWQAAGAEGRVQVALARAEITQARPADVGKLAPGPYAVLRVQDDGPGIAPQARPRLFEPFFTTKPRGQGTGLGLYVVSGIVRAHRGAIEVGEAPGGGTVFSVYFPAGAAASAQAQAPSRPAVPAKANGERVAYVDDDEVVQLMVQRVLERAGFDVAVFSDPWELLDRVRTDPACFDLLVTDYSMPGRSGLQVAREVRRVCPAIPIIVTTGYATEEVKAGVQALGGAMLLQKERTFEELGEKAVAALSQLP